MSKNLTESRFFIEDFDAIKEIENKNKKLNRLKNKVQNEIIIESYKQKLPQKFSYLNKKLGYI